MSNFDETLMKRLTKLEREVERLRVKERPVGGGGGVTDHGALGGLSDNDHPQYLLTTGKAADADKLDGIDSTDFGRPVFLTTPLTSTDWDGDARSTTSKTLIDLSAVFGVPAGVKAVNVLVNLRDSDSAGTYCYMYLSPNNTAFSGNAFSCSPVSNRLNPQNAIVPCNADGDIYYQLASSGIGTLAVLIQIWGYWL